MKTIYSLLLLSSFSAFAAETPLFYMQMRSGFTPPQYAFKKECEVYETKAVITLTKVSGTTVTEKTITVDPQWDHLITVAMDGELAQETGPADFGYRVFLAFKNADRVILSALNDDGDMMTNLSQEAKTLEEIISKLCE